MLKLSDFTFLGRHTYLTVWIISAFPQLSHIRPSWCTSTMSHTLPLTNAFVCACVQCHPWMASASPPMSQDVSHHDSVAHGSAVTYITKADTCLCLYVCTGSIGSLEDISFSPMGQAVSHQASDLAGPSNGMPFEAEPARSSEVCSCLSLISAPCRTIGAVYQAPCSKLSAAVCTTHSSTALQHVQSNSAVTSPTGNMSCLPCAVCRDCPLESALNCLTVKLAVKTCAKPPLEASLVDLYRKLH